MKHKKGARIYYTGDMANQDGWGTITEGTRIVHDQYHVTMDDGREFWLSQYAIGDVYKGHCDPRFVTKAAHDAWHVHGCVEAALFNATTLLFMCTTT